jgi:DnaD/phage-associated family protein
VAGWIKLWRKLKDNGHLKMPGAAFKLWIFCLLEAAPYPDKERNLAAGELWLSYDQVRYAIGDAGKQMSKSTVSGALKYLEQNGYLTTKAIQFYGVKVKVANWHDYQANTDNKPSQVQKAYPSSTESVPVSVPVTVPAAVLVRESGPYWDKAFQSPKNKKNIENIENKEHDVVVDIPLVKLDGIKILVSECQREFGRPLSPIEIKQLTNWLQTFPAELIKEALVRACLHDKRTIAYIGGILRNWAQAGITTIEETKREQPKPGTKGGKRNAKGKPGYRPREVDWANEPDTL